MTPRLVAYEAWVSPALRRLHWSSDGRTAACGTRLHGYTALLDHPDIDRAIDAPECLACARHFRSGRR